MKKFIYILLTFFAFNLASCSQEEIDGFSGKEISNISVFLEVPVLQTRAYGEGENAKSLRYILYETTGEGEIKRDSYKYPTDFTGVANISLQVATSHNYKVVFWASASGEDASKFPYALDETLGVVTVDYSKTRANDEDLDAFYGVLELSQVKGDISQSITLKRPFAQINIGTSDLEDYKTLSGKEVTETSVSINKAYTKLNLFTGIASDATEEVSFSYNDIPVDKFLQTTDYKYLALVYVLANETSENCNLIINYGETERCKIGSVPIQRNHRTNIYGRLLTSQKEPNVDKDSEF